MTQTIVNHKTPSLHLHAHVLILIPSISKIVEVYFWPYNFAKNVFSQCMHVRRELKDNSLKYKHFTCFLNIAGWKYLLARRNFLIYLALTVEKLWPTWTRRIRNCIIPSLSSSLLFSVESCKRPTRLILPLFWTLPFLLKKKTGHLIKIDCTSLGS